MACYFTKKNSVLLYFVRASIMQYLVVSNLGTDVDELALSSETAEYCTEEPASKIQRLKMNTEFSCL
uniref:Uncharacterized protein n=1 Tax=Arundo donax TaxID=35708 RepID=A0A0A9E8E5_ARUDO